MQNYGSVMQVSQDCHAAALWHPQIAKILRNINLTEFSLQGCDDHAMSKIHTTILRLLQDSKFCQKWDPRVPYGCSKVDVKLA